MSLLMCRQVRTLSESLIATWVGAQIRLLTRMSSQMSPQIEVQREFLATEFTLERFLALMIEISLSRILTV
jgi:hypothetical protein